MNAILKQDPIQPAEGATLLAVISRIEAGSTPVPESGCWLWMKSEDSGGYGTIAFRGKTMKAHRVSWLAFRGNIPSRMNILHKCDTPLCVNPDHLFLGTQHDNIRDMVGKGRQRSGGEGRFGHNHPAHRLSIAQVRQIRSMHSEGDSQHSVAARFGVSVMTVNRIVRGISWRGL